jgi:hypothetical protein
LRRTATTATPPIREDDLAVVDAEVMVDRRGVVLRRDGLPGRRVALSQHLTDFINYWLDRIPRPVYSARRP